MITILALRTRTLRTTTRNELLNVCDLLLLLLVHFQLIRLLLLSCFHEGIVVSRVVYELSLTIQMIRIRRHRVEKILTVRRHEKDVRVAT